MKKTLLFLTFALGVSTISFAQTAKVASASDKKETTAVKAKMPAEQRAEKFMTKFQSQVSNLSADQASSIKAILVSGIKDGQAAGKNKEAWEVLAGDAQTKISAILTPAQKPQFDGMLKKMKANYEAKHAKNSKM